MSNLPRIYQAKNFKTIRVQEDNYLQTCDNQQVHYKKINKINKDCYSNGKQQNRAFSNNQSNSLSPFTWTNIKLKLPQINKKSQKNTIKLQIDNLSTEIINKNSKQLMKNPENQQKNQRNAILNKTFFKKSKFPSNINRYDKEQIRTLEFIHDKVMQYYKKEQNKHSNKDTEIKISIHEKNRRNASLNNSLKNISKTIFYQNSSFQYPSLADNQSPILPKRSSIMHYVLNDKKTQKLSRNELIQIKLRSSLNNSLDHSDFFTKTARQWKQLNLEEQNISEMQAYMRRHIVENFNSYNLMINTHPKYLTHKKNMSKDSSFSLNPTRTLFWTKNEIHTVFREKNDSDIYNHIEGSYHLTSKQKLYELLSKSLKTRVFFPQTFALTKQYEKFVQEYDFTLMKIILNSVLMMETDKFQQKNGRFVDQCENIDICLANIVNDLSRQRNQSSLKLLKFCILLEYQRHRVHLTEFFEKMQNYQAIDIKISQNLYIEVIEWCVNLENEHQSFQKSQSRTNFFDFSQIDYRLIKLLKNFHKLFTDYLPSFMYSDLKSRNLWIVKPNSSSKSAGISLINNSQQFYTTKNYQYNQYKYKARYENKIIQKYIANPLIIKHTGIDFFYRKLMKQKKMENNEEIQRKIHKFMEIEQNYANRKFDLRQWVVIRTSNNQQQQTSGVNETHSINFQAIHKSPKSMNQADLLFKNNQKQKLTNNSAIIINKNLTYKNILEQIQMQNIQKSYKKNKFQILKYQNAYCRFAKDPYNIEFNNLQCHLTNYAIHKRNSQRQKKHSHLVLQPSHKENASVLMLNELFEYLDFLEYMKNQGNHIKKSAPSSRQRYFTQLDEILRTTLQLSLDVLKPNSNTFQLFGFDLMLDQKFNLYLLEINLNPQCEADRYLKLKDEAKEMVQSLMQQIVLANKANICNKWNNITL